MNSLDLFFLKKHVRHLNLLSPIFFVSDANLKFVDFSDRFLECLGYSNPKKCLISKPVGDFFSHADGREIRLNDAPVESSGALIKPVSIQHRNSEAIFRGSVFRIETLFRKYFYFSLQPWVASVSQLNKLGFSPFEFPGNESISDLLLLIELHETTLNDLARASSIIRKKNQDLERANSDKLNYLSMLAHEIITPLSGIQGSIELASMETDTKRIRNFLSLATESSADLVDLCRSILDFSSLNSSKAAFNYSPTKISKSATDVLSSFQSIINERLTHVYFDCNALEAVVIIDEMKIKQVFRNLLSNSIKYLKSDSSAIKEIAFFIDLVNENGKYFLNACVVDNGIGFDPKHADDLFNPFIRTDESKSVARGIGMGLPIVRSIIEAFGGHVCAHGKQGDGASFYIQIPVELDGEVSNVASRIITSKKHAVIVRTNSEIFRSFAARKIARIGLQLIDENDDVTWRQYEKIVFIIDCLTVPFQNELEKDFDACYILAFGDIRSKEATSGFFNSARSDRTFPRSFLPLIDELILETLGIPVAASRPASSANFNSSLQPSETVRGQNDKGSVLLIEDNDVNRNVISQQLATLGYAVDSAFEAEIALDLWMIKFHKIILTDIKLPGMSGIDFALRVRSHEKEKRLTPAKIIAITANVKTDIEKKCFDAGIDILLRKPATLNNLSAALESTNHPSAHLLSDLSENIVEDSSYDEVLNADALLLATGKISSLEQADILDNFSVYAQDIASNMRDDFRSGCTLQHISELAHKLKSSARLVGAFKLANLAESLENMNYSNEARKFCHDQLELLQTALNHTVLACKALTSNLRGH